MNEIVYSLNDFKELESFFLDFFFKNSIFLFKGEIGAGKTTLINYLIKNTLKSKKSSNSPTYSYLNINFSEKLKKNIYHFDLYRIKKLSDLEDLGLEEFLNDKNAIIFIEWPDLLIEKNYFKDKSYKILNIDYKGLDKRIIKF